MSAHSVPIRGVPRRRGGMPGGGPPAMRGGEKPRDFKKSLKSTLAYIAPHRRLIAAVMAFAALSAGFGIAAPKIMVRATDELASSVRNTLMGLDAGVDFGYIGRTLLLLVCLYIASAAFSYAQGFIMSGVTAKVAFSLRSDVMKKINCLPLAYFNRTSHGDVLSRVTNDIDTLSHSLNQSLSQMISSLTTVIGVLVMMLSISWQMTLVAIGILPVTALLVAVVVKASQRYFRGNQEFLGAVNGRVEEMYSGHLIVKAFCSEDRAIAEFEEENGKLYNSAWRSQFLSGLMMPVMNFVGNLGYVVICLVGAIMAAAGSLTIGGIQAFIQYVRSFTQPISQMANISNQVQMAMAAGERVFEFLAEDEEINPPAKAVVRQAELSGEVLFESVEFGYEGVRETVIHHFTARVKAGQRAAIVGPTGAGKTTLVKLLMRFHELRGGAIYVDGCNIADFDRHDIRRCFGMVLQDTWLYNDTILENIRYGRLDASDDEVVKAAKIAEADHFIRTLPGGYNMELNEDATNISEGQKQLLTIARAVLADSRLLILDEATSFVDTRTEVMIQRAMRNLMKGRTSFVIAHRLSTIRDADVIFVLNEGDIVEQGSHEELLAKGGFYANLYYSQFESR